MIPIILIESKKYFSSISASISSDWKPVNINRRNISLYNNNPDVVAIACSRGMAHEIESLNFPNCKLIQLESVGYDNVDLNHFVNKNIAVCNAQSIYDNCLSEYVIFAMLLYAKRFHRSPKRWWFKPFRNYHYMTEIAGKTVGIMGVGHIGTAIAKRLSTFDVRIIGYANNTKDKVYFEKIYHKDTFNEFLSSCDYLINVLPHNSSTIGLLNIETLKYLKPKVVFINIGRESIYEKNSFVQFMRKNSNAVAILDIFEIIPRIFTNPLRRLSNVLIFPRVAAISQESDNAIIGLIIENINRLKNNHKLVNQLV